MTERQFFCTSHMAKQLGVSKAWVTQLAKMAGVKPYRSQGKSGLLVYTDEQFRVIESYRDSKAGKDTN